MSKFRFLLQTLSVLSIFLFYETKVFCEGPSSNIQVRPSSIHISAGRDFDAVAYKRIYREITIQNYPPQPIEVQYIPDTNSSGIEVKAIINNCDMSAECQIILEIFGNEGSYSGLVQLNDSTSKNLLFQMPLVVKLEKASFSKPEKVTLESSKKQNAPESYPNIKVQECRDLKALDRNLKHQCFSIYDTLMNQPVEASLEASNLCKEADDFIEKSKCEGTLSGIAFKSCDNLNPLAKQRCESFQQGAVKDCKANDFDCHEIREMFHGYVNCAHHQHGDILAACTAFQNAYLDGISKEWFKDKFLPAAKNYIKADTLPPKNSFTLQFINPKRLIDLGVTYPDLQILTSYYPSLSRSILLNTNYSKSKNMSAMDVWKEIESHLYAEQTVGYELECPGVQLDITSGRVNSDSLFSGILFDPSPEERERKKLNFDEIIETEMADRIPLLSQFGIWKAKKEWPFLDTYSQMLFESKEYHMDLPFLKATLESRYSYNHFPHVEMVTAPLTKNTLPLRHDNAIEYISKIIDHLCDKTKYVSLKSTSIDDWLQLANQTPVDSLQEPMNFRKTDSKIFDKTPMICNNHKLNRCHVQSNVGVYLDQFFTDAFLIQTIGSNIPYHSDAVYNAAWEVSKNIFSTLQWDSGDKLIDGRNHAAGIFTYFVNDLYLRSILYAGEFDFWKGTISHLLKNELRHIWKTLRVSADENEKVLFQTAALQLWNQDGLPEQLEQLTETILSDFKNYSDRGGPSLLRKRPHYSSEFAKKVNGIFKEMVWTIALADESSYNKAMNYNWGSIVSKEMKYYDFNSHTMVQRQGFTDGCAYADHDGSQCDLSRTIEPGRVWIEHENDIYPRTYAVVETRYGLADFNQAVFWRCHDEKFKGILDMTCYKDPHH